MAAMTGFKPLTDRQSNILSIVQAGGRSTRKDIARTLDLPLPTVTRIVSDLRDSGYLLEDESEVRLMPGRPNGFVQINARIGYAIGVDLRKQGWDWAVSDAGLQLAGSGGPIPEEGAISAAAVVRIIEVLRGEMARIGISWNDVSTIVFAVHAIVSTTGDIFLGYEARHSAFNVDRVAAEASGKRCASNDPARMYMVVERDPEIDRPDSAYVLYGRTGHGMGIVVGGQMLRSFNGISGEIGHLAAELGSGEGHRQTVADRTTGDIVVAAALAEPWGRELSASGAEPLALGDICSAARSGHQQAADLLCRHAGVLAPALASTVSLLGCETLVLGGAWSDSGERVRQHLLAEIRRNVAGALSERVSVRYGRHGPDCIASGAAYHGSRLIWTPPRLQPLATPYLADAR